MMKWVIIRKILTVVSLECWPPRDSVSNIATLDTRRNVMDMWLQMIGQVIVVRGDFDASTFEFVLKELCL